jgi:EmrB/QacA subfamily drug resistance transporter
MTDQARAPVEHPLRDVRSQAPAFHPARRQTARAAGAATLVVLCVAEFMIALDFSIVNVALPAIKASLGFSQAALQWVITAYALAFGGLLLLGGRAADLYGRRRLLVGGLALFAAASLLAGLATSPGLLVGMRAVQGAAAAVIAPAALSLLTTTFTEESARRRALGAWGAVLGAGFVTGVVAGGVLTTFLGWRAVFFVNVPIASLAAIATFGVVPEPRAQQTCRPRLDVLGAALATTVVVLTVYAVTGADAAGWFSLQTLGLLAVALLLLSGFLYVESKIDDPLVPLEIFRLRALSTANVVNMLLIGAFAGYVLVVTLFLQQVHSYSPLVTGLTFVAAGVAGFSGGFAAPPVASRLGTTATLAAAAVTQAVGLALLTILPRHGTIPTVALLAVVVNFADVVAIVMINGAATADVPTGLQGLAGGVLNTTQQVGAAVGVAVISAVATTVTGSIAHGAQPSAAALSTGFRYALAVAAALSLAAALAAATGMRHGHQE